MLGTNRQFEALIDSLESQIAKLESSMRKEPGGAAGLMLAELHARQQSLRLLLFNRQAEAANPIVDFQIWRDGNGAISVDTAPSRSKRSVSM